MRKSVDMVCYVDSIQFISLEILHSFIIDFSGKSFFTWIPSNHHVTPLTPAASNDPTGSVVIPFHLFNRRRYFPLGFDLAFQSRQRTKAS